MPLVVAVTMECLAIGPQDITSAQIQRDDVVEFNAISIAQVQSTEATPPLLGCKNLAQRCVRERVVCQSPRPVHQVAVKRTGCSLNLDMPLDAYAGMGYEAWTLWCGKTPVISPNSPPVPTRHPGRILPGMSPPRPMQQKGKQRVVTAVQRGFGRDAAVIL